MEWTDGKCSLQNFERHLQGSYLSDWTQVVEATKDNTEAAPVHNMVFFNECAGNFLANLFDESDWTEQADYIRAVHKPKPMTPKQFLLHLRHLVLMLGSFPQAPPNISMEDELQRIFLYARPALWVDRYENAGMTASLQDMSQIKRYMECQQAAKEGASAHSQRSRKWQWQWQ